MKTLKMFCTPWCPVSGPVPAPPAPRPLKLAPKCEHLTGLDPRACCPAGVSGQRSQIRYQDLLPSSLSSQVNLGSRQQLFWVGRTPLTDKKLAGYSQHELRKGLAPLGGKSEAWVAVLGARALGEKLPETLSHTLGGISVVPKVPLNLKTIRKQVSGTLITWQSTALCGLGAPGLCCYGLQLGVRNGCWCLPAGEGARQLIIPV